MNKEELLKRIIMIGLSVSSNEEALNEIASAIYARDAVIEELVEALELKSGKPKLAVGKKALAIIGLSEAQINLFFANIMLF